ncbi:5-amino-6-(5-phospho-D-ribitylamino)uracil phosphatase YigB [Vibrio sp. E150_011]
MRFYRNLPTIKAMTFDLDDTLYDNHPVIERVEQQAAHWLYSKHPISQQWDKARWHAFKIELLDAHPELKHDVTKWREQQIVQGLVHLGYDVPQAQQVANELIQLVLHWRSDFDVPHETHQVLKVLSQSMPLVAMTNGNVNVEAIGLAPYFSLVLKAGPDGRAKPHADMFDKAAQYLGCERSQILHVGDHVITDVAGAKRHGFSVCWFNDTDQTARVTARLTTLPDIEICDLRSLLSLTVR